MLKLLTPELIAITVIGTGLLFLAFLTHKVQSKRHAKISKASSEATPDTCRQAKTVFDYECSWTDYNFFTKN